MSLSVLKKKLLLVVLPSKKWCFYVQFFMKSVNESATIRPSCRFSDSHSNERAHMNSVSVSSGVCSWLCKSGTEWLSSAMGFSSAMRTSRTSGVDRAAPSHSSVPVSCPAQRWYCAGLHWCSRCARRGRVVVNLPCVRSYDGTGKGRQGWLLILAIFTLVFFGNSRAGGGCGSNREGFGSGD